MVFHSRPKSFPARSGYARKRPSRSSDRNRQFNVAPTTSCGICWPRPPLICDKELAEDYPRMIYADSRPGD